MAVSLALFVSGCGGSGSSVNTAQLDKALAGIVRGCSRIAFGRAPSTFAVSANVDTLLRAYHSDPNAPVSTAFIKGGTLHRALENVAGLAELCSPHDADRIHEALATG